MPDPFEQDKTNAAMDIAGLCECFGDCCDSEPSFAKEYVQKYFFFEEASADFFYCRKIIVKQGESPMICPSSLGRGQSGKRGCRLSR